MGNINVGKIKDIVNIRCDVLENDSLIVNIITEPHRHAPLVAEAFKPLRALLTFCVNFRCLSLNVTQFDWIRTKHVSLFQHTSYSLKYIDFVNLG